MTIFYDRNFGDVLFNVIQNPPNYSVAVLRNIQVVPQVLSNQYAVFPNSPLTLPSSMARMLSANLKMHIRFLGTLHLSAKWRESSW